MSHSVHTDVSTRDAECAVSQHCPRCLSLDGSRPEPHSTGVLGLPDPLSTSMPASSLHNVHIAILCHASLATEGDFLTSRFRTVVAVNTFVMDQSQSIPQSLVGFMRQADELIIYEDFTRAEEGIPSALKQPSRLDMQRVEFRAIIPK